MDIRRTNKKKTIKRKILKSQMRKNNSKRNRSRLYNKKSLRKNKYGGAQDTASSVEFNLGDAEEEDDTGPPAAPPRVAAPATAASAPATSAAAPAPAGQAAAAQETATGAEAAPEKTIVSRSGLDKLATGKKELLYKGLKDTKKASSNVLKAGLVVSTLGLAAAAAGVAKSYQTNRRFDVNSHFGETKIIFQVVNNSQSIVEFYFDLEKNESVDEKLRQLMELDFDKLDADKLKEDYYGYKAPGEYKLLEDIQTARREKQEAERRRDIAKKISEERKVNLEKAHIKATESICQFLRHLLSNGHIDADGLEKKLTSIGIEPYVWMFFKSDESSSTEAKSKSDGSTTQGSTTQGSTEGGSTTIHFILNSGSEQKITYKNAQEPAIVEKLKKYKEGLKNPLGNDIPGLLHNLVLKGEGPVEKLQGIAAAEAAAAEAAEATAREAAEATAREAAEAAELQASAASPHVTSATPANKVTGSIEIAKFKLKGTIMARAKTYVNLTLHHSDQTLYTMWFRIKELRKWAYTEKNKTQNRIPNITIFFQLLDLVIKKFDLESDTTREKQIFIYFISYLNYVFENVEANIINIFSNFDRSLGDRASYIPIDKDMRGEGEMGEDINVEGTDLVTLQKLQDQVEELRGDVLLLDSPSVPSVSNTGIISGADEVEKYRRRQLRPEDDWQRSRINVTDVSGFSTEPRQVVQPTPAQVAVNVAISKSAAIGWSKKVILRVKSELLKDSPIVYHIEDPSNYRIVLSTYKEALSEKRKGDISPDFIKNHTGFSYISNANGEYARLAQDSAFKIFERVASVSEDTETQKIYDIWLSPVTDFFYITGDNLAVEESMRNIRISGDKINISEIRNQISTMGKKKYVLRNIEYYNRDNQSWTLLDTDYDLSAFRRIAFTWMYQGKNYYKNYYEIKVSFTQSEPE